MNKKSMFRFSNLLYLFFILAHFSFAADYTCNETCVAPECMCASPTAPGGLTPAETPQFVLITFDDALNATANNFVQQISDNNFKNPNNAVLPFTFYVSTDFTDYHLVQQRYAQGHEIAVHTITHSTNKDSDYDKWRSEIVGAKKAISELGQVPADEIIGFRAPFLAHANHTFQVLYEEGFLYESSISEQIGKLSKGPDSFIFPFTYDNLNAQNCSVGECPTRTYPGLWEVPMWGHHNEANTLIAAMDPPGAYQELYDMFTRELDERHAGNRAPLGIFLHAGWLSDTDHVNALNDFITYAYQKTGVWFVTNQQLVSWMKDPKKISEMNAWSEVQAPVHPTGTEIADGFDNNGDGNIDEGFVSTCSYGANTFKTTATCPTGYIAPVVVPVKKITTTNIGEIVALGEPCSESDWNNSTVYGTDDIVSLDNHTWKAKWYATGDNNKPGTPTGNMWVDLGECEYFGEVKRGKLFREGLIHVPVGEDKSFAITPNPGYQVKELKVDNSIVPTQTPYTFQNVTHDHTFSVEFTNNSGEFSLTAATTTGGSVAGTTTLNGGATAAIIATPTTGYSFSNWTITSGTATLLNANNASTNITIGNNDVTVQANFTQNSTQYNLTINTSTGGTATNSAIVTQGVATNISAQANTGFSFVNWTVTSGTVNLANASAANTTVTLASGDATIQANFIADTQNYTVSVAASAGGSASGGGTANSGTPISITASANSGFSFSNWSITSGSGNIADANSANTTVTLSSQNATVQANFTANPVLVTLNTTSSTGGTATPNGSSIVTQGNSTAISATANTGYTFSGWTVENGIATFTNSSNASTNVILNSGNATIKANFTVVSNNGDVALLANCNLANGATGVAPVGGTFAADIAAGLSAGDKIYITADGNQHSVTLDGVGDWWLNIKWNEPYQGTGSANAPCSIVKP